MIYTYSFDIHTGLGDSCHVCHAFRLQAPQLSPVVEFFSHLGHFTPPLSIPPLNSMGEHGAHRGQRGMDGAEKKLPTLPPSSSSLPPFIEQT